MLFDDQETLEAEPKGTWLVTFADVVALLLAFFVMLFSMSNIETETWDQIISGLSYSENPKKDLAPRPQATKNVATVKLNQALSLDYLANVLEDHLTGDKLLGTAFVHRLDGLVVVSLPSDTMFGSGEVELQKDAKEALFRMGGLIATIGNRIDVRGHTDPEPLSDKQFDSKWAISLARAAAVATELRQTGYARQIPIYGLADTRFVHLDAQIPEAARHELARRVDVVIHPHSGRL